VNNLIAHASRAHVALEGSTILNLQNTLFAEAPKLYQATPTKSIVGAPAFAGADDFTLLSGPGEGQAIPISPNDAYKAVSGGVDYRSVHGVDLPAPSSDVGAFGPALLPHPLVELGASGPAPPVQPAPAKPATPKLPDSPRNWLGALGYIAGKCVW
jgi:hypothetical protein